MPIHRHSPSYGTVTASVAYNIGANAFANATGNYHRIYSPGGLVRFLIGNASDASTYYDNDNHYFRLADNSTQIARINSTGIYVGSTKVIGAQAAAVADATDNASAITQLNDLLAKLRTHGLIAT